MKRILVAVCLSILVAHSIALAGYSVDVSKVSDFSSRVGRIAILPGACDANADCVWLEKRVARELRSKYDEVDFVSASIVKQTMLDLGIEQLDEGSLAALAEHLEVDSFLVMIVRENSKESEGAVGFWTGNTFFVGESEVSTGNVALEIIEADTGKKLLTGTAFGESEWYGKKGVAGKAFRKILQEAFRK